MSGGASNEKRRCRRIVPEADNELLVEQLVVEIRRGLDGNHVPRSPLRWCLEPRAISSHKELVRRGDVSI